jgi:hypothetical protein
MNVGQLHQGDLLPIAEKDPDQAGVPSIAGPASPTPQGGANPKEAPGMVGRNPNTAH